MLFDDISMVQCSKTVFHRMGRLFKSELSKGGVHSRGCSIEGVAHLRGRPFTNLLYFRGAHLTL